MLEEARHETNDRKSSQSASCNVVESADHQKLFDNRDQYRHDGMGDFPGVEGFHSREACVVIERQVHIKAASDFNEFDDRNLGPGNQLDRILFRESLVFD